MLASCGVRESTGGAVPAGTTGVRCVNAASGTAWTFRLDEPRGLADGEPARMDGSQIDWRSASDQARYQLDRRSGALTVTRASSTGGYMIIYRCAALAAAPGPGAG